MKVDKTKSLRSSKWTFLIYDEGELSYDSKLKRLNDLGIPFALSPWHDKDVKEDGSPAKKHRHGVFYFDSLKSYSQVSKIVSEKLESPKNVEIVHSETGLYDYFTHANNKEKAPYNPEDIVTGCGFNKEKFISSCQTSENITLELISIINENKITELSQFIVYVINNVPQYISNVRKSAYFYSKYIDSIRYNSEFKIEQKHVVLQKRR